MIDTKYLRFTRLEAISGRRTVTIDVISLRSGDRLAVIRWHGQWRQYALFPEPNTIWNPECLDDVNKIIRALMAERKEARA